LTAQPAVADTVAYYRYSIGLYQPGPHKYVGPLPSAIGVGGRVFAVSSDAMGRVTKVIVYRDGVAIDESDFEYSGNARYYSATVNVRSGEITGRVTYTRDANGYATRIVDYTREGTLTGYATGAYATGRQEYTYYTPTGTLKSRDVQFFSPDGVLERDQTFYSDTVYTETELDTATGLATTSLQYNNGKINTKKAFTYNADGDLTRIDFYDPATNQPFGFDEFANGLQIRRSYHFSDGTRKEIVYGYDAKRLLSNAALSYNGTLICTFTYDRQPDGTVKRTLASGPNGELYAEYPNAMVNDVYNNGSAASGAPGTIYKTGNWF